MASMVVIDPEILRRESSSGIAVISLLFSRAAVCPKYRPLCVAKAEKMIREIGKSLLLEKDKSGEKIDVTAPVTEDHSE